jgi:hypothetical protein
MEQFFIILGMLYAVFIMAAGAAVAWGKPDFAKKILIWPFKAGFKTLRVVAGEVLIGLGKFLISVGNYTKPKRLKPQQQQQRRRRP